MKFRKKPVVIEAWQWMFSPESAPDPAWMRDALNRWPEIGGAAFWPDGNCGHGDPNWADKPHIVIKTLEGDMIAQPGDWIIQSVKGELYPCKPDIFEATYEPVP